MFVLAQLNPEFTGGLVASLVFGLIGLALLLVGYWLFDLITPRLDVQEQLTKGNTAVAIVIGALL